MIRLLRSELLKLRTTRTPWWLLAGAGLLAALSAAATFLGFALAGTADRPGAPPVPPLVAPEAIRSVLSGALSAKTLGLVAGVLIVTTEFRHMTVTPTFLAAPRRSQVVGAKLLAGALLGLGYGVVAVAAAVVTGYIAYAVKGETFDLSVPHVPQAVVGMVLVVAIYTVVGIGLGTLLRNQVAAILVGIGWNLAVEKVANAVLTLWSWGDDVYRWLPGNAASAVTSQFVTERVQLLQPWQGGLLLAGYGVLFAVLGSALTLRRDVT